MRKIRRLCDLRNLISIISGSTIIKEKYIVRTNQTVLIDYWWVKYQLLLDFPLVILMNVATPTSSRLLGDYSLLQLSRYYYLLYLPDKLGEDTIWSKPVHQNKICQEKAYMHTYTTINLYQHLLIQEKFTRESWNYPSTQQNNYNHKKLNSLLCFLWFNINTHNHRHTLTLHHAPFQRLKLQKSTLHSKKRRKERLI